MVKVAKEEERRLMSKNEAYKHELVDARHKEEETMHEFEKNKMKFGYYNQAIHRELLY